MSKEGLDYISLDVRPDNKLKLIEAEFGLKGFAVIVKLFQRIGEERGYYCEFDDEVALMFSSECKEGVDVVSEIVRAAIRRGIFDKQMYEKYNILTSHGLQCRYLIGAKRRTRVELKYEYLLLGEHEITGNVYINKENVYINSKNVYKNQQSKVKESKVKYSKVDDNADIDNPNGCHRPFGCTQGDTPYRKQSGELFSGGISNGSCEDREKQRFSTSDRFDAQGDISAFECYEANIGTISQTVADEIKAYLADGVEDALICAATRAAAQNNKRSWNYISAIINSKLKKGIKTYAAFLSDEEEFKRQKEKKPQVRNKFNNYEDENSLDYAALDDLILDRMLEEG